MVLSRVGVYFNQLLGVKRNTRGFYCYISFITLPGVVITVTNNLKKSVLFQKESADLKRSFEPDWNGGQGSPPFAPVHQPIDMHLDLAAVVKGASLHFTEWELALKNCKITQTQKNELTPLVLKWVLILYFSEI